MSANESARNSRGRSDSEANDVREEEAAEAVDLDLDAEDARLREAVGKPTTVRVDGVVIHVEHAAGWSNLAMRSATSGDWNTWASEVIADEEELSAFLDANLVNYQLEAIFNQCGKAAQMSMGKSRRGSASSRRTRRN